MIYTLLIRRLGALFGIYTAGRVLFLALNANRFRDALPAEILTAFVQGLQFDASAIITISSLFILFSLLPMPCYWTRAYQGFLRFLYFVPNAAFLVLQWADLDFYKFTDRRTTVEILWMKEEVGRQALQLLWNFWHIVTIGLAMTTLLAFVYPLPNQNKNARLLPPPAPTSRLWARLLAIPVAAVLCAVLIRGSFSVRPLSSGHAFRYSIPAVGNLALNSPFVFIKSIQGKMDGETTRLVAHFPSDTEARSVVLGDQPSPPVHPARGRPENLVLIIVESLSSEYTGFENGFADSYTPFLDSLARKGLAFTNHYANSKRSITALPAIIAGIPDWFAGSISTSVYQNNTIYGLGHGLRSAGYSTTFFHGTRNGTMTFDSMSAMAGIENYYALNEYGAHPSEDDDHAWGVFDEPMLQRVAETVSDRERPFAAVVFTLSTHQPFSVPAKYQGKFRKGPQPIHEAVGYTDHAIRRFFETAETKDWFNRTLFVVTGDHTAPVPPRRDYDHVLGGYDVPLLFYRPGRALPTANTRRVAQQTDISPSILDLLGASRRPHFPFGRSLFSSPDSGDRGLALLRLSEQRALLKDDRFVAYNGDSSPRLYRLNGSAGNLLEPATDEPETLARLTRLLRAHVQVFDNGLIRNDWFKSVLSAATPGGTPSP